MYGQVGALTSPSFSGEECLHGSHRREIGHDLFDFRWILVSGSEGIRDRDGGAAACFPPLVIIALVTPMQHNFQHLTCGNLSRNMGAR